jgi:hypothetical protein
MAKRKRRTAKRRTAKRKRAKARRYTKVDRLVALAQRPAGVSLAEIIKRLDVSKRAAVALIGDARYIRKVRLQRRGDKGSSTWHA